MDENNDFLKGVPSKISLCKKYLQFWAANLQNLWLFRLKYWLVTADLISRRPGQVLRSFQKLKVGLKQRLIYTIQSGAVGFLSQLSASSLSNKSPDIQLKQTLRGIYSQTTPSLGHLNGQGHENFDPFLAITVCLGLL